jgi:hypothetical protein
MIRIPLRRRRAVVQQRTCVCYRFAEALRNSLTEMPKNTVE